MEVWRGVWRCPVWPDVCSGSGGGASCADHMRVAATPVGERRAVAVLTVTVTVAARVAGGRGRVVFAGLWCSVRAPRAADTRAGAVPKASCSCARRYGLYTTTRSARVRASAGAARERDAWRDERPDAPTRRHAHRVSTRKRARTFIHAPQPFLFFTYLLFFFFLLDYGAE
jgi:hypothetical protein